MITSENKYKDELLAFSKNFQDKKDKRIILYGTGRKTATLLESLRGFNIIGICDKEPGLVGTKKYGFPVLNQRMAEQQADLLIINTMKGYWQTIYSRIRDWKIPIYFADGSLAEINDTVDTDNSYWDLNISQIQDMISRHKIITFDIFDTLLSRNVCFPADIFELLERKSGVSGFSEMRKQAESQLIHPDIAEIYQFIALHYHISPDMGSGLINLEIETDKESIYPRKDMIDLCRQTMDNHEVYLISDMYYSSERLQRLLSSFGLNIPCSHILSSCDKKKCKADGTLWRYFKEYHGGEKILHVGDDENGDYVQAQKYNVDTLLVYSPLKMNEQSSIKKTIVYNDTPDRSVALGLINHKLFHSPLALAQKKGHVSFEKESELGYCLLGGPVYTFCSWLYENALKDNITNIVFLGRDGYFMKPQFQKYLEEKNIGRNIKLYYLETSRKILWKVMIETEKDIEEALHAIYYDGTFKEVFQSRFDIIIDSDFEEQPYVKGSNEEKRIIRRYKEEIIRKSKQHRKLYLEYIYSLNIDGEFAIVDLSFYGSIQFYLSKILKQKIKGYYWSANLSEANPFSSMQQMSRCYGNDSPDGSASNFIKRALFMEAFFTAPLGTLTGFDEYGNFLYEEEKKNQKNFDIRYEMQEGILQFIHEAAKAEKLYNIRISDEYFWNSIFEVFMDNGFIPSERIKKAFYRDDSLSSSKEYPVWE